MLRIRDKIWCRDTSGGVMLTFLVVTSGVLWALGYVVACRIWPYTNCRRCKGNGRFRSPSGRAWRLCRRCKGSGSRVRTGRRVWTWLAAVKKAAVD